MRNFLSCLFLFLTTYLFSQCTYSVWLRDTYGDGWNGGYLQIYINGVYTYGNYTLPSGSGPAVYNFNVFQGQSISVRYFSGSWSSENYYRVYSGPNATGSILISTTVYQTPPMWTYPTNICSSPLQTQPPSSISPSSNTVCSGQTVTLTANNSVGTTYWFTTGCTTVGQIATGASINVNPSTTTTYYARNHSNGIWSSTCAQTTISVNNNVQSPTPVTYNINCGVSPTLTAIGGPGNYQWWSNSNGTGLLSSGQTYSPGIITSNSVFYVTSASGSSGTYNQSSSTVQTYNNPGSATTSVSSTPANATGNATLTVYIRGDIDNSTEWVNVIGESGSLGYVWGGSQCSSNWTTATYTIPAATINSWASNNNIQISFNSSSSVNNICGWGAFQAYFTLTYQYSGGCNSQPTPYTINMIPLTQPTANNTSVTCGNSTTLSITNAANNVSWFSNSNGTGLVGTGPTYNTPQLTSSTTYYLQATNGSCQSPITSVSVTVNPLATPTVTGNSVLCLGNSTTLTASGGQNLVWYSNSNGTGQLGTGSTYTTPQLNNNTTYYVGSQSQPQTQTATFNINSIGQLVNMNSNCGSGSYYNGCSGMTGFNWNSSLPAGATVTSVQIQLSVGVECQAGTRTTTLNNVNGPTFNTINHCSCSGSINPIFTLNMNPANYVANGTNQFRITNPPSCFGLFNGSGGLPGNFARVIVTYTIGSACSSSLAAFPITISNTTQFNQQSMPIMQQPTMTITQHPSGQYGHWYNGFQNDQYIATSSVSTDYLTIRMGQPQGSLVTQGTQPVSFNGPATGSYYIHVNTNSNCGNDNQLRTITVNRVSALPVELLSFDGTCDDNFINLNWKTASEHNSHYFEIQKSRDGENWSTLTTVESAGNSTQELSYTTKDENTTDGNNYYKLLQFDVDGLFKEYGPINVLCSNLSKGYFSVFPNPSSGQFQLVLNDKNLLGESEVIINDTKGSQIFNKIIDVKPGINTFLIEELKNSTGLYYIYIRNSSVTTSVIKIEIR